MNERFIFVQHVKDGLRINEEPHVGQIAVHIVVERVVEIPHGAGAELAAHILIVGACIDIAGELVDDRVIDERSHVDEVPVSVG